MDELQILLKAIIDDSSASSLDSQLSSIVKSLSASHEVKLKVAVDEASIRTTQSQLQSIAKQVSAAGSSGRGAQIKVFDAAQLNADGQRYFTGVRDIVSRVQKQFSKLGSVDVVNVLLMIYDCCFLIRRVIRLRERILLGCCRAARSFISPWLPKRRFSEKVSQTTAVAADTPKPIHVHCPMPAVYMMTNTTNTASSPKAKIKRYWARSPLNSTSRPTPLFISKSDISYCLLSVLRGRMTSG